MGNRIDRPSYSDMVSKHRKEREEKKKKSRLTPEEEAELDAEEAAFVPAGPSRSSIDTHLENKDRQRVGVPEKTDTKPKPEQSKEELDFMQGKVEPLPKEAPEEDPHNFFSNINRGIETQEKKKTDKSPHKPAAMPTVSRRDRADTSDLEQELAKTKDLYNNAQSQIDKREAIEAFFNGLGKIGAGVAGRATGTDMSGVKFDKQDWEKKRERTGREFEANRQDIRQQGKDREQTHQFDVRADQADMQFTESARAGREAEKSRAETLAESIRHNQAMEDLGWGKHKASLASAAASSSSSKREEVVKKSKEVGDTVKDAMARLESGKVTEEEAKGMIRHKLVEQLGASPEQAEEFLTKDGLIWGRNNKDMETIYQDLAPVIFGMLHHEELRNRASPGRTAVVNTKTGEEAEYPSDQLDSLPPPWTPVP